MRILCVPLTPGLLGIGPRQQSQPLCVREVGREIVCVCERDREGERVCVSVLSMVERCRGCAWDFVFK